MSNYFRVPHTRHRSPDATEFPRTIDITRFPEVGRIRRPSGATSREDYDNRVAILDELYEFAQLDLLIAFRDGEISMDDLARLKRLRQLDHGFAGVRARRPLVEVFRATLPQMGKKARTRKGYQSLFLRMLRLSVPALTEDSPVLALEGQQWNAVLDRWLEDGASGQTWSNFRGMLGSFLSKALGKESAIRQRIMEQVPTVPETPARVPDVTPEKVAAVLRRMPRHTGATALTLLVTGLRVNEWLSIDLERDLLYNLQGIRVQGASRPEDNPFTQREKRRARIGGVRDTPVRYVPVGFWDTVVWAAQHRPAYITLRRHWCKACADEGLGVLTRRADDPGHRWPQSFQYEGMTLHDLRHCYAQWVHAGGLPLTELQSALGHATFQSTVRYAQVASKQRAAEIAGQILGEALSVEALWSEPSRSDEPETTEEQPTGGDSSDQADDPLARDA